MKECTDHHITWPFFELLACACTDELLSPYVKTNPENVSVDGYCSWLHAQQNAGNLGVNYIYMQEMVFNILLAIISLRISIRRYNYDGYIFTGSILFLS